MSRYAMKVADMTELANKCAAECQRLTAAKVAEGEETMRTLRGAAVVEALGGLEINDICRRIVDAERERTAAITAMYTTAPDLEDRYGHGILPRRHNDSSSLDDLLTHKTITDHGWMTLPSALQQHATYLMEQRHSGAALMSYRPPNPRELVRSFKVCGSAAEIFNLYCEHIVQAREVAGLPIPTTTSTPA
jgi:hypothetical protein